jgi:hypothetical protein
VLCVDCGDIDVEFRTAETTKLSLAIEAAENLLRASRPLRITTNPEVSVLVRAILYVASTSKPHRSVDTKHLQVLYNTLQYVREGIADGGYIILQSSPLRQFVSS